MASVLESVAEVRRVGRAEVKRGFVGEWAVTLVILLFGTTTLVQGFVIPTGSMEDNLLIGDHLLVDKLAYAPAGPVTGHLLPYREIRRGDIIVFRFPLNIQENYVKRVIGVPGDHIRIDNRQLILNGRIVNEPYKFHKSGFIDQYRDNFPGTPPPYITPRAREMLERNVQNGELVVPAGFYFAMGDNRDNSYDSRYWGLVPRGNITGKPVIIYWSYDAPTEQLATWTLEGVKDVALNFFTKTRWRRTCNLIRGYPLN